MYTAMYKGPMSYKSIYNDRRGPPCTENLGLLDFWIIKHHTVDGRNPAPLVEMYKTLETLG